MTFITLHVKKTGIKVQLVDFADPQGGKSPSDRFAAVLKSRVRRYLNEKNDITNASEFVNACLSYGGTPDVKVSECRLLAETNSTVQLRLPGITSYNNFKFEKDGVLAYPTWAVGDGKFFPFKDLKFGEKYRILDCEEQTNFMHEWTQKKLLSKEMKSTNTIKLKGEEPKPKLKSSVLFECNEEGCIKKFLKYSNLIHHLASGEHVRKPEQYLLKDAAIRLYHSKTGTHRKSRNGFFAA